MNKKVTIIAAIVGVLLIGGGVAAYTVDQNNKKEEDTSMQKTADENDAMVKEEAVTGSSESMKKEDPGVSNESAAVQAGSYVSLATYNANKADYSNTKKVYFFHAKWCSICQAIDKEISVDPSKIPAGVTLIKTDFDDNVDLRQKYGVTQQYTFVQVDSNANSISKYSATTYDDLVAGIKT